MADSNVQIKGIARTQRILNDIPKDLLSARNYNRLGNFFMEEIKRRTAQGEDVNGGFFKAYSKDYAEFRAATGHQTSPVNLFFSGSMMAAMTYKISTSADTITLYFRNTEDRRGGKNPVKAAALNETRKFFDVNQAELDRAAAILRSTI